MKNWRVAIVAAVATIALIGAAQAITDTIFHYSTPKTGYFGLSPMAFVPENSFVANNYSIVPIDHVTAPAGGCFNASVNLPHGATVTRFYAWYTANASSDAQFRIWRSRLSDGFAETVTVIDLTGVNTSGARAQAIRGVMAPSVAVVDNGLYVYGAYICLSSGNVLFNAARLTYTYTHAGN